MVLAYRLGLTTRNGIQNEHISTDRQKCHRRSSTTPTAVPNLAQIRSREDSRQMDRYNRFKKIV